MLPCPPDFCNFKGDTGIRETEVKALALLLIKAGFGKHGLSPWLKLVSFYLTPKFYFPTNHRQREHEGAASQGHPSGQEGGQNAPSLQI